MRLVRTFIMIGAAILLAACAPSSAQLKRAVEADPDIVYVAFQKDPEKFLAVMTSLTAKARAAEKVKEIDELLKNPKRVALAADIAFVGAPDAPVVIVEYSDMQCPYCRIGHAIVSKLLSEYPGKIRIYFKHNPLKIHPQALPAAQVYEAIALQDREMARAFSDAIFKGLEELEKNGERFILKTVRAVGADVDRVLRDRKSPVVAARIQADIAEAGALGFSKTPSFLVNGVPLPGAQPIEAFKAIIDRQLATK